MARNSGANKALEYLCKEFTGIKEAYTEDLKGRAVSKLSTLIKAYLEKQLVTPLGPPQFFGSDNIVPVWKKDYEFTLDIKLVVPEGMQPHKYDSLIQPIISSDDFSLGVLKARDSDSIGTLIRFKITNVLPKSTFIVVSANVTLYHI